MSVFDINFTRKIFESKREEEPTELDGTVQQIHG
jgi:hypothetical protein